jgi:hypothetical protein
MKVRCSSTIPVSWTSTRGLPRSSATDPYDERERWESLLLEVLIPHGKKRSSVAWPAPEAGHRPAALRASVRHTNGT